MRFCCLSEYSHRILTLEGCYQTEWDAVDLHAPKKLHPELGQ
jgi:hypothetical protein